jgi:hypothetical protein
MFSCTFYPVYNLEHCTLNPDMYTEENNSVRDAMASGSVRCWFSVTKEEEERKKSSPVL